MKTLVENQVVKDLDTQEVENISGGIIWIPVALYIMAEWTDIKSGISDALNNR